MPAHFPANRQQGTRHLARFPTTRVLIVSARPQRRRLLESTECTALMSLRACRPRLGIDHVQSGISERERATVSVISGISSARLESSTSLPESTLTAKHPNRSTGSADISWSSVRSVSETFSLRDRHPRSGDTNKSSTKRSRRGGVFSLEISMWGLATSAQVLMQLLALLSRSQPRSLEHPPD